MPQRVHCLPRLTQDSAVAPGGIAATNATLKSPCRTDDALALSCVRLIVCARLGHMLDVVRVVCTRAAGRACQFRHIRARGGSHVLVVEIVPFHSESVHDRIRIGPPLRLVFRGG